MQNQLNNSKARRLVKYDVARRYAERGTNSLFYFILFLFISLNSKAQTQLWGTTHEGGANGLGTIFMSDSTGNSVHTVYDFQTGIAKAPLGGLCLANNGNFYGVTGLNGFHHDSYCNKYNSTTGIYTNIQDFFTYATDGWCAKSHLIKSSSGMLYGLCAMGGNGNVNAYGVIYSIDPITDTYNNIYDFDSLNGAHPYGSLIQANNGKLYGIAEGGGANNSGVIFSFDPTNSIYTKLYDFPLPIGGLTYYGSLEQATNGKFYGATQYGGANNYGELFSFNESTTTFTDLYDFDFTNGSNPRSNLIQATDGNFYGLTYSGGVDSLGVLFRIDSNANYTKLLDFIGINGAYPTRRLLQSRNGKLFGTTTYGGINNVGVAFSYDITTNIYTKLIDFDANINGSYPDCEIIETPELGILGMTCLSNNLEIIVYPNPATTEFTINAEGTKIKEIKIYNVLGEMLKSFDKLKITGSETIDISILPSGIYFIQVKTEQGLIRKKFVKE